MALVGRDRARLAAELAEQPGVGVVLAREHDPAEIEPAQPAEDLRVEVGALEPEQEQLRDLALYRQASRQVGHAARHARAARLPAAAAAR